MTLRIFWHIFSSFLQLHSSVDRGDGRTKYILKGEGAGSVFVIDSRTGNIHVTKPLDREEKDQYRLIATATDRQTGRALEPSSQFIIRVQDINDNPPVFQGGPYSATVPEMANIGTALSCTHANALWLLSAVFGRKDGGSHAHWTLSLSKISLISSLSLSFPRHIGYSSDSHRCWWPNVWE